MSPRLNLLPAHVERRQAAGRMLRLWGWIGGAAFAAALLLTWREWHHDHEVHRRHAALQQSFEATQKTLQDVKLIRRELEMIQSREGVALSLASERPVLTLLGLFASAAHAGGNAVVIERFTFHGAALPVARRPGHSSDHEIRVELRGVATNNLALAEFVAAIRAWDLFAHVDLKSTGAMQLGAAPAHRYAIECMD